MELVLGRGWPFLWDARCRAPRATDPSGGAKVRPAFPRAGCLPLLLGLAPGGVFPAAAVAGGAVRSYRTVSPLPPARCSETDRRCTFCGTFPGVAPAGRYPAPYLRGARTFLPPPKGQRAAIRPSGTRKSGSSRPACQSQKVQQAHGRVGFYGLYHLGSVWPYGIVPRGGASIIAANPSQGPVEKGQRHASDTRDGRLSL